MSYASIVGRKRVTHSDVQLRSRDGATQTVSSLKDAYQAAQSDHEIWKLSWDEKIIIGDEKQIKDHRFLVVRYNAKNLMSDEEEKRIRELCPEYQNAKQGQVFWVDQPFSRVVELTIKRERARYKAMTEPMFWDDQSPQQAQRANAQRAQVKDSQPSLNQIEAEAIVEVCTDKQFYNKYVK